MATEYDLNVEVRNEFGKGPSRKFVREGRVPINFYGAGINSNFTCDAKEWAAIENKSGRIIMLNDGTGTIKKALVGEVQRDFLKGNVTHVDMKEVIEEKAVVATIPVRGIGTPKGCGMGGMFEQVSHEIKVTCLAANLPDSITVDVSGMEINTTMHASAIELPEGVEAVYGERYRIFAVQATRASLSSKSS